MLRRGTIHRISMHEVCGNEGLDVEDLLSGISARISNDVRVVDTSDVPSCFRAYGEVSAVTPLRFIAALSDYSYRTLSVCALKVPRPNRSCGFVVRSSEVSATAVREDASNSSGLSSTDNSRSDCTTAHSWRCTSTATSSSTSPAVLRAPTATKRRPRRVATVLLYEAVRRRRPAPARRAGRLDYDDRVVEHWPEFADDSTQKASTTSGWYSASPPASPSVSSTNSTKAGATGTLSSRRWTTSNLCSSPERRQRITSSTTAGWSANSSVAVRPAGRGVRRGARVRAAGDGPHRYRSAG